MIKNVRKIRKNEFNTVCSNYSSFYTILRWYFRRFYL